MQHRGLLVLAGMIFALVGAAHIARMVLEMEVLIGGWSLPLWGSFPAALILFLLAYLFFRAAGKQ